LDLRHISGKMADHQLVLQWQVRILNQNGVLYHKFVSGRCLRHVILRIFLSCLGPFNKCHALTLCVVVDVEHLRAEL
jgi:hypothetical protein